MFSSGWTKAPRRGQSYSWNLQVPASERNIVHKLDHHKDGRQCKPILPSLGRPGQSQVLTGTSSEEPYKARQGNSQR